jgi:hypothetical protein
MIANLKVKDEVQHRACTALTGGKPSALETITAFCKDFLIVL